MASTQLPATDKSYLADPTYGRGWAMFRGRLVWDAGTATGVFVPPDESGIREITHWHISNATAAGNAPQVVVSNDGTLDKDKLTISGPANTTWDIVVYGKTRQ